MLIVRAKHLTVAISSSAPVGIGRGLLGRHVVGEVWSVVDNLHDVFRLVARPEKHLL